MTDSISSDRAFIPFNLSSVAPLDALAAALSELPVAQPREPAGEFSSFLQYEVPTSAPAPDTEMEMIRLIRNTAREGAWQLTDEDTNPPDPMRAYGKRKTKPSPWIVNFCAKLSSSLSDTPKRPCTPSNPVTPRTHLKRPRQNAKPHPQVSADAVTSTHFAASEPPPPSSPQPIRERTQRVSPEENLAHEKEIAKISKDVDLDELNEFTSFLTSFTSRPDTIAARSGSPDGAILQATVSLSYMMEFRQKTAFHSQQGSVAHVDADLLANVIAILQARVQETVRECALAAKSGEPRSAVMNALLGTVAASTILTILATPSTPRKLLLEELLDDLANLLRSIAVSVIFPIADPIYRAAKYERQRSTKKADRNSRNPNSSARKGLSIESDDSDDAVGKQSGSPWRPLNKKEGALIEQCCTMCEVWANLFRKEKHLPDAVVSQCSNVCVQSIQVTGIPRLQTFAAKTLCAIFLSCSMHRLSILDDVREAASLVPATRKHLRSYKLSGEQTEVRVSSAVLALLLCAASVESETKKTAAPRNKSGDGEDWVLRQRKRYDRVAKMAMHVVEPLLSRAYTDREPQYRTAFQSLFEDLLTLYGKPEWPSSELMLQTLSVAVITKLRANECKTVYARSLSVDILGALAGRMCTLYGNDVLRMSKSDENQVLNNGILEAEREKLLLFLNVDGSPLHYAAHSFYEVLFVTDDASVLLSSQEDSQGVLDKKTRASKVDTDPADHAGSDKENVAAKLARVEKNATRRAKHVTNWRLRKETVARTEALDAARFVGNKRSFARGFMTIVEAILDCMHDPAPTVRAKSIKALSTIDESCCGLLQALPDVLSYIESSCRDVSTLARDAALDLLSRSLRKEHGESDGQNEIGESQVVSEQKVLVDDELFSKVFSIVEKRLWDTATSVRKRAISIMRSVLLDALAATESFRENPMHSMETAKDGSVYEARVVQISASLVARLEDPETSVRDAAEKTVQLGLFGFDVTDRGKTYHTRNGSPASLLAERLITVYTQLPTTMHVNFMTRVVQKSMLASEKPLFVAIVNAAVEQLHGYESKIANITSGRTIQELSESHAIRVKNLSTRRVACSSVICAFGELEASLIVPHCRTLAPTIAGVLDGGMSESDLLCVQRILNVLELGLGKSTGSDLAFLNETMYDVDAIICQSPIPGLEEPAVRCLCVIARKTGTPEAQDLLQRAADNFKNFLEDKLPLLQEYCSQQLPDRPTGLERNARGAVVRLGLLTRYGDFRKEYVEKAYEIIESTCKAVYVEENKRDILAKNSVRAMVHFVIRHRSFLPRAMDIFVSLMNSSSKENLDSKGKYEALGELSLFHTYQVEKSAIAEGVQLCVLQGFHELLRDEEERNSSRPVVGSKDSRQETQGSKKTVKNLDDGKNGEDAGGDKRGQVVLAAEEDAEAGYLALGAQALLPTLKVAAVNQATAIRRTVANILGLLVRQGLILPATIVPCLFTLLLDVDSRCREYSFRVVSFLADRHSGMLASAALPALRECFECAFPLHVISKQTKHNGDECRSVRQREYDDTCEILGIESLTSVGNIETLAVNKKTGQSLLSAAIMTMHRDQRRGVLEGLAKEFDPRAVLRLKSEKKNCNDEVITDDEDGEGSKQAMEIEANNSDDDAVGGCSSGGFDLETAEKLCPLPNLYFLAYTLACIDYTNGAGVGGSLSRGGGTAAADTKMKIAREDVADLIAIATRIISNSGQAILGAVKLVLSSGYGNQEKKRWIAVCASRISVLLQLKQHLKVNRWKSPNVEGGDSEEIESNGATCPMPAFKVCGSALNVAALHGREMSSDEIEMVNKELVLFKSLMKEDAIDEADMVLSGRRSQRSAMSSGKKTAGRTSSRRNRWNGSINRRN